MIIMGIKRIRLISVCWIMGIALSGCSHTHRSQRLQHPINYKLAINAAQEALGAPYKYGGQDPSTGFDCSGLVVFSFLHAGITLPRTALAQLKVSHPVKRHLLRAGDLVFFRISRSRVSHVGIYLGNKRFIHAPSTGKLVSIARLDDPYWKKRFIRAGRI